MSITDTDRHSAALASLRSSQHLSAWLLALLLLVPLVLGVYQIVQAHDEAEKIAKIDHRVGSIEKRINQGAAITSPAEIP